MFRVFVLIVDRDCDPNRRAKLDHIERRATQLLAGSNRIFVAEEALEEVEVWVLAGLDGIPWAWQAIRTECHPKERYFDQLVGACSAGSRIVARNNARPDPVLCSTPEITCRRSPKGGENPQARLAGSPVDRRVSNVGNQSSA